MSGRLVGARPKLASRRCWEAEPYCHGVRCTGCREPFDTLTDFEWHVLEAERGQATSDQDQSSGGRQP